MASHLSLLKAAVVSKLQEAPAVCSLVEEEALGNWPTSVAQAVVVRDNGSEVSQTSYGLAGVASWTSTLVVEGDDKEFTAMAKTVGLPLAIFARLWLRGDIQGLSGVQIPIMPEVYEPVLKELEQYGIVFTEKRG